jgi:signal transduction histidine kinase
VSVFPLYYCYIFRFYNAYVSTIELRTPLNGICGMVELLLHTPLNEQQKEYVNVIRRSSDALLSLINEILDFSKMEAGKLQLDDAPFELDGIVDDVMELLGESANKKSIDIIQKDVNVGLWLRGDSGRLRQILTNLVSNAIKFTEIGYVSIGYDILEEVDNVVTLKFQVTDTGMGISNELMGKLFRPFGQLDVSSTRGNQGTGLGLVGLHAIEFSY